jgi:hypothetical protein
MFWIVALAIVACAGIAAAFWLLYQQTQALRQRVEDLGQLVNDRTGELLSITRRPRFASPASFDVPPPEYRGPNASDPFLEDRPTPRPLSAITNPGMDTAWARTMLDPA